METLVTKHPGRMRHFSREVYVQQQVGKRDLLDGICSELEKRRLEKEQIVRENRSLATQASVVGGVVLVCGVVDALALHELVVPLILAGSDVLLSRMALSSKRRADRNEAVARTSTELQQEMANLLNFKPRRLRSLSSATNRRIAALD